jgi:hypothetical protein
MLGRRILPTSPGIATPTLQQRDNGAGTQNAQKRRCAPTQNTQKTPRRDATRRQGLLKRGTASGGPVRPEAVPLLFWLVAMDSWTATGSFLRFLRPPAPAGGFCAFCVPAQSNRR